MVHAMCDATKEEGQHERKEDAENNKAVRSAHGCAGQTVAQVLHYYFTRICLALLIRRSSFCTSSDVLVPGAFVLYVLMC